ncbi:MAG: nucleotidyltransferase substrate binding protein [Lewinellaceae bacterium]|nr:nucleotidyltransferase substrate binding protein [Lewinellaceae bacterium]
MMGKDIRWHQRFSNYNKALAQLEKAVRLSKERELSDLEQQGIIQAFEYTHELAWNTMKDYFEYQGDSSIKGSRDATRAAFKAEIITNGEDWMDMIRSRNKTSHTYNQETADEIYEAIVDHYFEVFKQFQQKMEGIRSGEQGEIFSEEL